MSRKQRKNDAAARQKLNTNETRETAQGGSQYVARLLNVSITRKRKKKNKNAATILTALTVYPPLLIINNYSTFETR